MNLGRGKETALGQQHQFPVDPAASEESRIGWTGDAEQMTGFGQRLLPP
jgi:hypothetical protein